MITCPAAARRIPDGFRFCGRCGNELAPAGEHAEVRKVVTIVFCDLTGSTALGHASDPRRCAGRCARYYDEMRGILERHGGTVEKFVGDAVMAVFGVPVSHEDDALRAVRAAWEMRDGACRRSGSSARIGVNTGEVVAGSGDSLVTGDAVNVAARLEQAAAPGEVLVGAETQRLVRDAVVVEPVDRSRRRESPIPSPRSGWSRSIRAQPRRARDSTRRWSAATVSSPSSRDASRGPPGSSCHLFTLLGPAGVGKSRLVAEFSPARMQPSSAGVASTTARASPTGR